MQRHRYKDEIILDVGCGRDQPLPRLMYANKMTDFAYVGIDMNDLEMHPTLKTAVANGKADIQLMGRTDASRVTYDQLEFEHPTIAVCFEVLEHVHPEICQRLVRNIFNLLDSGGHAFFSTPVWNGSAAANHINEMKRRTVGALLEYCGFEIQDHYGTFASQSEIESVVRQAGWGPLWDRLGDYYDSNVFSNIFAPVFPQYSRNCIWHVRKTGKVSEEFQDLSAPQDRPLGQHPDVEELFA
jgi:2-polyprenyl-3-methyl-5-hydroxy-6-metoxy-1,4-benzoquinol methylase